MKKSLKPTISSFPPSTPLEWMAGIQSIFPDRNERPGKPLGRGVDSRFRGNDVDATSGAFNSLWWIPAFAGMTKREAPVISNNHLSQSLISIMEPRFG